MSSRSVSFSLSRRGLLQLAGAGGVAALLPGCSTGSGTGSGSLSYRIWSADQLDAMRALAAEFKAKSGELVKIDVIPDPPYWTKMEAAAGSGALPDVFWMHIRQFVLYAANQLLEPIDDVLKQAGVNLSDYPSILIDAYKYGGKQYALPRNFNLIALYYNKQLFGSAGVSYPDSSWTWDDLQAAAKKLTNPSAGTFGFAAPLQGQTGYWNAVYQNNGRIISADMKKSGYDLPETVDAIKWWTGFIKDGTSPTHQAMTETSPSALFRSGKLAMYFDGDWQASTLAKDPVFAKKFDVAVLPQGARRASIMHGSGNVVSAKAAQQDKAASFVQYLASPQAQEIQSKMGASGPPSVLSTYNTWADIVPGLSLRKLKEQVKDAVLYPHSRDTDAWAALETKYLTPVWAGTADVQTATSSLAAAMNDVLAREQK